MKTLLLTILLMSSAHAAHFVVEAKHVLTQKELAHHKIKIEPFGSDETFARLYVASGDVTEKELMALSWVKNVEPTFELQKFAVVPVDRPTRLVTDELLPYQWSLLNEGQTTIREKDDINNIPLVGVPGKDVGWKSLLKVSSVNKTIVAVLDSGVDITHPEFKDALWKNDKECGKDPKIDNDGNKLPGDCHGWNFTESLDSPGAKDPSDMDGHGTHVAGIIAAAQDGHGTVGVSQNVLIMPIKVMKDSHSNSDVPSSLSFARGIEYAVKQGAQVINMSLGWPRSLETKYLRDSVALALSRGVIIVAAAGNNNNSEPLFPCAYDGVVCVAASNVQGEFSGFSNYGGHVDVVAPGENILSTNPVLFEPEIFSIPGYEIKSGTSQASPLVAGMLASLKAFKPDLKIIEVFARIYRSSKNPDKKKYVLGGDIVWDDLVQDVTTPVIHPILKRVRQVVMRADQSETKLAIPVRNFGQSSQDVLVKVESLSPGIEFQEQNINLSTLLSSQVKDAVFDVSITNLLAESSIKIKISITEGDKTETFFNEIPVVRDIRAHADFKKRKFIFADKPLPLGKFKEKEPGADQDLEVVPLIQTVEAQKLSDQHDFYLKRRLDKEDKKTLELTLFQKDGESYKQVPKLILIENALDLINLKRIDLNLDGQEDYFVHSIAEKDKKKYLLFSFYDKNLNPLWKDFQHVALDIDLYVEIKGDLSFLRYVHPKLGTMLVPAFVTEGQLPKLDQVLTQFDKLDTTKKKRLYYMEPVKNTFRIRSLTTNVWENALKKELGLKWFETVVVEELLRLTEEDLQKSELRVMVSAGLASRRQYFIYSFSLTQNNHGKALPQIVLQTDKIDPLYKVSSDGLEVVGDVYFNIYDRTRSKVIVTKQQDQLQEYIFRHEANSDVIAGHILSFEKNNQIISMLQSREGLITITSNQHGIKKISTRPKIRYGFLSQKLLSEMYYPVTYERDGQVAPGLYVDGTSITANRVYLYEEKEGVLVSSIKNSLVVPAGCKALNPRHSSSGGGYEFVFLCLEENEWLIKTFDMN